MYFTKAQLRALWFLIIVLTAAIVFQYVEYYAQSRTKHDFSSFDSLFLARRDSILQVATHIDTLTPQQYQNKASHNAEKVVIQQFPININEATIEELEMLPRIGPAMAKRIIDYRHVNGPFMTPKDIIKVKGIGEKTYLKLKELITVK